VKPPRLIALCGLAGSGKTTCAEYLRQEWGYSHLKFASPIKEMLRALGLNDDHLEGDLKEQPTELLAGHSPRHAMQTLGTEWGRELMGLNFWADMWAHSAERILKAGGKVVVDDCRFPNELAAAKRLGGLAITVVRPGISAVAAHRSENPSLNTDWALVNDGGRAHLFDQLCVVMNLNCE
jgi:hypothetical protein